MKNDKPVGFSSLRFGFPVFVFFKFFQIFKKIKSNRLVFGDPAKPVWDFAGFHKNRPVFVDISIHEEHCPFKESACST
jgi:hypothetical protein